MLCVCLVEDDASVRSSIGFALEVDGHRVDQFASAAAALGSSARAPWTCLVIDYHLPDMDGLALLAQLRERGVDAPTIVITSNPTRRLKSQISKAGALLVEKPLLRDVLSKAIQSAAGQARLQSQSAKAARFRSTSVSNS